MNLARTSILSFIAVAVRIAAGIVINKAIALYVGPAGLALVGQFQSFSQICMTLAQAGLSQGVVKYTAEYKENPPLFDSLLGAATRITLISSCITSVVLIFGSDILSNYILDSNNYGFVFIFFGATITFFALNSLVLSVLNGTGNILLFTKINIGQSLYSLVFTTILVFFFGLKGALVALATNQAIVFALAAISLKKSKAFDFGSFFSAYSKKAGTGLLKYALMAITTVLSVTGSHIFVRSYLGESLGWEQAGYWQAVWTISTMYLSVVTMTLSVYYLPKLSSAKGKELKKELINGYIFIIPITVASATTLYLLRDIIISLLFSESFEPMRELFMWQLIGDVFKIAAWLLAYLMLAKTLLRTYIATEIAFAVTFSGLTVLYVESFGLIGVTYAFATNYLVYLFVVIGIARRFFAHPQSN